MQYVLLGHWVQSILNVTGFDLDRITTVPSASRPNSYSAIHIILLYWNLDYLCNSKHVNTMHVDLGCILSLAMPNGKYSSWPNPACRILCNPNTLLHFLCDEFMYEDLKPFFYVLSFEKEQNRKICDKYFGRMSLLLLAPRFKFKWFITFLMKGERGLILTNIIAFVHELQLILIKLFEFMYI